MKKSLRPAVLTAALALLAPAVAAAQPAPANPTAGADAGANSEQVQATVRTENGRRVYVASTTIEVRGEIQRPYAFSVSGRSSLGYSYFEAPIHFIREILDAVRREPF
ncbi:MAG: hypothetical protein R3A52_06370 [Polyangiales bacterium]